jgi:hypothetical protein
MRRPVGKLTMNATNTSGSAIIRLRCILSIVVDMKYVDDIWLTT